MTIWEHYVLEEDNAQEIHVKGLHNYLKCRYKSYLHFF